MLKIKVKNLKKVNKGTRKVNRKGKLKIWSLKAKLFNTFIQTHKASPDFQKTKRIKAVWKNRKRRLLSGVIIRKLRKVTRKYKGSPLLTPKLSFNLRKAKVLWRGKFATSKNLIAFALNSWKEIKNVKIKKRFLGRTYFDFWKRKVFHYRITPPKINAKVPKIIKKHLLSISEKRNDLSALNDKLSRLTKLQEALYKKYREAKNLQKKKKNPHIPAELFAKIHRRLASRNRNIRSQLRTLYNRLTRLNVLKSTVSPFLVKKEWYKIKLNTKYLAFRRKLTRRIKQTSNLTRNIQKASLNELTFQSPTRWWRIRKINKRNSTYKKVKARVKRSRNIPPRRRIKARVLKRSYFVTHQAYKLHQFIPAKQQMYYYRKRLTGIIRHGNVHLKFKHNNMFFITLTTEANRIVYKSSGGLVGMKGPKRSTDFARQLVAKDVAKKPLNGISSW